MVEMRIFGPRILVMRGSAVRKWLRVDLIIGDQLMNEIELIH